MNKNGVVRMDEFFYLVALAIGSIGAYWIYRYRKEKQIKAKRRT